MTNDYYNLTAGSSTWERYSPRNNQSKCQTSNREQAISQPMFEDFRDVISSASEHLKDLQRTGQNIAFFQFLVPMLPDPNNPTLWENPDILDAVRDHLCEKTEDGTYLYAMIPVVAVGVAVQYANTRKEFLSIAGLHANGYRSKIREDLFYWNHFNPNRQALRKYMFSLRWLWHVLHEKVNPRSGDKERQVYRPTMMPIAVRIRPRISTSSITHFSAGALEKAPQ
jgi:hypothetical protein